MSPLVTRSDDAPARPFPHLLTIDALTPAALTQVLDLAEAFFEVSRRPVRKVPTLRGKTVINLFFEASTRTRTSFELAGKRLSADVVNISASGSSVRKGESLLDTCKTLEAMRPDVVVLRHGASGAAHYVSERVGFSVVNAGDGMHAHPTQALLDAFVIRRQKGRLTNLTVAICGDVLHSRVARSTARLLAKFGASVRFVGPRTLVTEELAVFGATLHHNLSEGIRGADVVMMLRVQQERLAGAYLPNLREYGRTFCLTADVLGAAKADVLVLHPGPMNRGVEIDSAVADGLHSAILDQVEAGVAVRMAVLYLLAGDLRDEAGVVAGKVPLATT